MPAPTRVRRSREAGIVVVIESFFALMWFGWGQDDPPAWLVAPLAVGSSLALVVLVVGIVVAARGTGGVSAWDDQQVSQRYWRNVGIEFGVAAAGAAVLAVSGATEWLPVWIAFVVGVHFVPMARVFGRSSLYVLGAAIVLVCAAAVAADVGWDARAATIACGGTGLCLLVAGIATLRRP